VNGRIKVFPPNLKIFVAKFAAAPKDVNAITKSINQLSGFKEKKIRKKLNIYQINF
jgi:hypothetical protein